MTFYLGKLLLPWPLSPSYGRTPQTVVGWRPADFLCGLPAAIFFMAWRFRRAYPGWMVAAAIVLSGLAPVLGIIPFKGQNFSTVADRYMYFPLVGVALVVASLTDRIRLTRGPQWAAVTVIGVLLILNVRYQAVWHDEMTLWSHAATAYPNQLRVYNNYGAVLQAAGSQEAAISQFNLALKARPNFADAYCNRGSSLGRLHRYSEALADQTRALELDPTDGMPVVVGRFEQTGAPIGSFSIDRSAEAAIGQDSAIAAASQHTTIGVARWFGSGSTAASATGDIGLDVGESISALGISFSIAEPTSFQFRGSIGAGGGSVSQLGVSGGSSFRWEHAFGLSVEDQVPNFRTAQFGHSGVLQPGAYSFFAFAQSSAGLADRTTPARATFDFDFVLGGSPVPVPEPASGMLLGAALLASAYRQSRRITVRD